MEKSEARAVERKMQGDKKLQGISRLGAVKHPDVPQQKRVNVLNPKALQRHKAAAGHQSPVP